MKNTKKIIGMLLVLAIAICMTIPAYAAGTGKITISNPQAGETYTAYKIFDVIYDTEKNNYAYTIADDSPWLATVQAYAADAANGLTVTDVATDDLYTVTFGAAFHAADFAAALKAANVTAGAISFTDGVASGLDLGYYFVKTAVGAICNLTTTDEEVVIYDKNEKPTIEKTASDTEVEVGETITYTITGKVPSTTGYDSYKYEISDTMDAGLTFNRNVTVKFGDDTIDAVAPVYNENGFVITYDMTDYQAYVGKTITITYTATVNETAIPGGAELSALGNAAKLVYNDDPNNPTTEETDADVDVYISNIVIDKYAIVADETDKTNKLADAKFKLYKEGENGNVYYKWDAEKKVVTWVSAAEADVVVTDADGAAQFNGIQAGTYYLEETEAPAGYNRLNEVVEVKVAIGEDEAKAAIVTGNVQAIGNQAGIILPSTGGIGTTIFYVLGTALIAAAFILIVTKKRMSTEK